MLWLASKFKRHSILMYGFVFIYCDEIHHHTDRGWLLSFVSLLEGIESESLHLQHVLSVLTLLHCRVERERKCECERDGGGG